MRVTTVTFTSTHANLDGIVVLQRYLMKRTIDCQQSGSEHFWESSRDSSDKHCSCYVLSMHDIGASDLLSHYMPPRTTPC
jgi:hypothetical protein